MTGRQAPKRYDQKGFGLGELSGWFTEGFDTKDLREAKTLLEALGDC
jgi:hypothetical protein